MTVIYSNCGDVDTSLLPKLWEGIEGARVIELTRDSDYTFEDICKAISEEKDFILFCGHGSPYGLFSPDWSSYVLSYLNVDLVHAKKVVGIWCHASEFAYQNDLEGFFSWMFISNVGEAYCNGCTNTSSDEINASTTRFCGLVNNLIKNNAPLSEWYDILNKQDNILNEVDDFNYRNLSYVKLED